MNVKKNVCFCLMHVWNGACLYVEKENILTAWKTISVCVFVCVSVYVCVR